MLINGKYVIDPVYIRIRHKGKANPGKHPWSGDLKTFCGKTVSYPSATITRMWMDSNCPKCLKYRPKTAVRKRRRRDK